MILLLPFWSSNGTHERAAQTDFGGGGGPLTLSPRRFNLQIIIIIIIITTIIVITFSPERFAPRAYTNTHAGARVSGKREKMFTRRGRDSLKQQNETFNGLVH